MILPRPPLMDVPTDGDRRDGVHFKQVARVGGGHRHHAGGVQPAGRSPQMQARDREHQQS